MLRETTESAKKVTCEILADGTLGVRLFFLCLTKQYRYYLVKVICRMASKHSFLDFWKLLFAGDIHCFSGYLFSRKIHISFFLLRSFSNIRMDLWSVSLGGFFCGGPDSCLTSWEKGHQFFMKSERLRCPSYIDYQKQQKIGICNSTVSLCKLIIEYWQVGRRQTTFRCHF